MAERDSVPTVGILTLNYAPEDIGIGPYSAGLAQGLVKRNFAVSVIAGNPYYPQWAKRASFRGWSTQPEYGVQVSRCPHYVPRQPSGLKRLVHHMSFALSASFDALRWVRERPDTIVAVMPSLVAAPVAWAAARLAGAKLWLHVQDFEVEAAVATGLAGRASLPVRLGSAVERWLLARADRVSSISPQMIALLHAKGVAPERTLELRNWANHFYAIRSGDPAQFREEWQVGSRKVLLYSGNIARKQGLGLVLDAARLLAHRGDCLFIVCGNGPTRAALEAEATDLWNVRFADLQPADRFGDLMRLADIHLLPQLADAADLVLPSKLTNMLASGAPVVATAAPGTGLHAEIAGNGIATPPGDAAAFADAIAALLDDPERRAALGANALQSARDRWRRDAILDRWAEELRALAGEQV